MVQLTTEQRVFIVINYTLTQNTTAVRNAFQERFPERNPPALSTILENVRKYLNAGTSLRACSHEARSRGSGISRASKISQCARVSLF